MSEELSIKGWDSLAQLNLKLAADALSDAVEELERSQIELQKAIKNLRKLKEIIQGGGEGA